MPDEPQPQWFRRGLRAIRGVVSVACLLASVGFAALWVRSYWWIDGFAWGPPPTSTGMRCEPHLAGQSADGRVLFVRFSDESWRGPPHESSLALECQSRSKTARLWWFPDYAGGLLRYGFRRFATDGYSLDCPHWCLIVAFGAFAVAVKPKPRLRFTIRDLLVAMTLVAVVVAALASLPRSD
jgi:hypothetical protein